MTKEKNKGFSLIELIVVIAMMAVATTVVGLALSNISLATAKNCATELKSTLEVARMDATKTVDGDAAKVKLYTGSDGIYIQTDDGTAEKIGRSAVSVKYKYDGATEYTTLGDSASPLLFSFNKATGAYSIFGAENVANSKLEIIVTGASREYKLTLYSKTGKISME